MAIKLTYKLINNGAFVSAIGKIAKFEGWTDQRSAYNAAKFFRRFKQEMETAQELYVKLVKRHAKVDEKGNLISPEDKPGQFEILDQNAEAWIKAREDFESVSFEIDCHPIPLEKLQGAELSAIDLDVIEPLLDLSVGL